MIPVISGTAGWNYDMDSCPKRRTCLLLTKMGVAVISSVSDSTKGYIAWSPLPDREDKKK